MNLVLYIAGNAIEIIPMCFSGCLCFEERSAKVYSVTKWVMEKYRASLALKDNWIIVLEMPASVQPADVKNLEWQNFELYLSRISPDKYPPGEITQTVEE